MNRIKAILHKEWLELRKQRALLAAVGIPPIALSLLPLVVMYAAGHSSSFQDDDVPGAMLKNPIFATMNQVEATQTLIGQQFGILQFILPLLVPSTIAAYSIVGEKAQRTLEPLLATPVTTGELLVGKSLAALIPAVVVSWLCAGLYVAGTAAVAVSPAVVRGVVSPGWLVVELLCTPLLALIAIAGMVMVSSRVSDPRTAQQIAGILVVVPLAAFFGQITGVLVLNPGMGVVAALVLAVVAVVMLRVAARMFQRESILTRWS